MLVGIAILCFIYAPLLTFLRSPPTKEEKKVGIDNIALESDYGYEGHKGSSSSRDVETNEK